MPSNNSQNESEKQPNQDSKSEKGENVRQAFFSLPPTVRIIIYTAFLGIFGLLGGSLLNSRPKPVLLAWTFIFFAGAMLGLIVRTELINHKHKHRIPRWLPNIVCLLIVGLCLGLCCFAVIHEMPEPIRAVPHFVWTLRTAESPSPDWLTLTNSYFFFIGEFNDTNVHGHIIIPASSADSVPELRFLLHTSVSAEMVTATFAFSEKSAFEFDEGWERAFRDQDPLAHSKSFVYSAGNMVWNSSLPLPRIRLTKWGNLEKDPPPFIHLFVRGKDFPESAVAFWLYVSTNISKPFAFYHEARSDTFKIQFPPDIVRKRIAN